MTRWRSNRRWSANSLPFFHYHYLYIVCVSHTCKCYCFIYVYPVLMVEKRSKLTHTDRAACANNAIAMLLSLGSLHLLFLKWFVKWWKCSSADISLQLSTVCACQQRAADLYVSVWCQHSTKHMNVAVVGCAGIIVQKWMKAVACNIFIWSEICWL